MSVDSAYTTEFLEGPGAHVEAWGRFGQGYEQEQAHRCMHKTMNKSTDKVKAAMDKKRLEYYKKKLLARREEVRKNIERAQEEGRPAGGDTTGGPAEHAGQRVTHGG